jgi:uncharacterized protein YdhG (YjbR/CyaY superfamily)
MASSEARTVEQYLAELPEERRAVIQEVRRVVLEHLPAGYEETMNWGMITYQVPYSRYPDTYNGKPLMYAALAAQKNNYSLYLSAVYQDQALKQRLLSAYEEAGIKPDVGKSCIRFRRLEKLPLREIGRLIEAKPVDEFIADYEAARKKP